MNTLIKTTIVLPEDVLIQAKIEAVQKKTTLSNLIREKLIAASPSSGKSTLQALAQLKLNGGPKDLSKNIDHYLYGGVKK